MNHTDLLSTTRQSVTTESLRLAFEEASAVDLREFFARVVRLETQ